VPPTNTPGGPTNTPVPVTTSTPGAINTPTPGSPGLPHTGSGLPWVSPLALLLGALLLAAGLRMGGLRGKRLD